MKLPCIKERGLKVFAATADQRISLGTELFLRTHFPAKFRRYRGQDLLEVKTESDIIDQLTNYQNGVGNRVFILFGAAGSGKSESIRFIETTLKNQSNPSPVFRISRTELDPVIILKKLKSITGQNLEEDILIKWEILKKKPVTLANSLVWNALSEMFDSDEIIIPISYKLRPVIEKNLRKSFSDVTCREELERKRVELISLEELQEVTRSCAINMIINYEQLRKHLVDRLETEVLGGYSFVETLKEVGLCLQKASGTRPVLLIDDLVQSMTIYATDLLDFFITLEEGNWDVVIGLTPASFEASQRGRELLTRLNYLDTFDDRLYKLWLTDEFGYESYSVTEENAADYVKNYLLEFKKINGYECGVTCRNYKKCCSMHWGENDGVALTPLNRPLAKRLFVNLFKGKGQARHFIVTIGEYLTSLMKGEAVSFLAERSSRENCVDLEDYRQRIFIETYMPLDSSNEIKIPGQFLQLLGYKNAGGISVKITSLGSENVVEPSAIIETNQIEKPEILAIRDWLEKKEVNKELLKRLRINCGIFLRELSSKIGVVRPYTSRPQGIIRRELNIEGYNLPLVIEGIDQFEGIQIRRAVGHQAFQFMKVRGLKGEGRQNLVKQLIANPEVVNMVLQTEKLHKAWLEQFEKELGISCCELSFLLYVFVYHISLLSNSPIILENKYKQGLLKQLPDQWVEAIDEISDSEIAFVEGFFRDWFQLRENFYDGCKLEHLINKYPSIRQVFKRLCEMNLLGISEEYKTGTILVKDHLCSLLTLAKQYDNLINDSDFECYCRCSLKNLKILYNLSPTQIEELSSKLFYLKDLYFDAGRLLQVPQLSEACWNEKSYNLDYLDTDDMIYFINFVAVGTTFPIYEWHENLKMLLHQVVLEYNNIFRCFELKGEEFGVSVDLLRFQINERTIEEACVIELVSFIEKYIYNYRKIYHKLNFLQQLDSLLTRSHIAEMKDLLDFIDYLRPFLDSKLIQRLNLELYYNLVTKCLGKLNTVWEEKESINNNMQIILSVLYSLNPKQIKHLKTTVCKYLVSKIKIQQLFNQPFNEGKQAIWASNSLVKDLLQISKGNSGDYATLCLKLDSLINKIPKNFWNKNVLTNMGLTNSSVDLLERLLAFETVTRPLVKSEISLLEEIIERMPEFANGLHISISLGK